MNRLLPQRWQEAGQKLTWGAQRGETHRAGRLHGSQQTSITWGPLRVQTDQGQGSVIAPCQARSGPGALPLLHPGDSGWAWAWDGDCPLPTSNPNKRQRKNYSRAKNIYKHVRSVPRPHLSRKRARGQGWAETARDGQAQAGSPQYLDFLSEVLPAGQELVQCVLGMLHVTAVLPVDQEPGWWAHTHTHTRCESVLLS